MSPMEPSVMAGQKTGILFYTLPWGRKAAIDYETDLYVLYNGILYSAQ